MQFCYRFARHTQFHLYSTIVLYILQAHNRSMFLHIALHPMIFIRINNWTTSIPWCRDKNIEWKQKRVRTKWSIFCRWHFPINFIVGIFSCIWLHLKFFWYTLPHSPIYENEHVYIRTWMQLSTRARHECTILITHADANMKFWSTWMFKSGIPFLRSQVRELGAFYTWGGVRGEEGFVDSDT